MNTSLLKHKKAHTSQGVALLFSILLTSTLLLVALGIAQVSYKEGVFALEARDSDVAFTAADTGAECALYMDTNGAFASDSDTFYCHNTPVNVTFTGTSANPMYQFSLALGPTSCTQVYVNKNYLGTSTQIESYGYNVRQQQATAPAQCVTSAANPNIVTRALRTTYLNPVVTAGP